MKCIEQKSVSPQVRNEIVRDVVAQMFALEPIPKKKFATEVAEQLVENTISCRILDSVSLHL